MDITNPFAVLSAKYDSHPHIVAAMECRYNDGRTIRELRSLVGRNVCCPDTLRFGRIVSFDGPCMADDCTMPRDPQFNYCCRPLYGVLWYSGEMELYHLKDLPLEKLSSLPW